MKSWLITRTIIFIAAIGGVVIVLCSFEMTVPEGSGIVAGAGLLVKTPKSIKSVKEEKTRAEEKRDAFEQFATSVNDLTPINLKKGVTGKQNRELLFTPADSPEDQIDTVCTLYRETIMNVGHYNEEYGESLPTNISTELGPDCAAAVLTNSNFNSSVQKALVQKSRIAAQERDRFVTLINSELESLQTAEKRLEHLVSSINQIEERNVQELSYEETEKVEENIQTVNPKCRSIIDERQSKYVKAPKNDGFSLQEYLYCEYEWTHPVVSDAIDIIEKMQNIESQVMGSG